MSQEYANLVAEHESFNDFINKQHMDLIVNFDSFKTDSISFIEWVSPKYLHSFTVILNQALEKNIIWQVAKLYKLKRICNPATAEQCDKMIIDAVANVVNTLKSTETEVMNGSPDAIKKVYLYYNKQWMGLFNQLTGKDKDLMEQFAATSYQLSKNMTAGNMPFAKIYHELVFTTIDDLQCSQDLKMLIFEESKKAGKKLEKANEKSTWQTVLSIVVVVLIILKWVFRAMRD